MPLLVENHARSTTLFALTGRQPLIWKPAGNPGDTIRVPDDLASDIEFLNALDSGVLSVVGGDDPEVVERLQRASTEWAQKQAEIAARAEEKMDRKQDRDLVSFDCIGPGARPGAICGAPALIRSAEIKEKPPLCDQHQVLAPQYYLTETGSKGEGATENREGQVARNWKRVEVTAPLRSL